ncbi:hypothetical protein LZ30DRAFT_691038 [Colletotrichum cereale]|nr:hypothetical protein LZ30DRAFT_691038 [Colletotrichum cereale]
MLGDRPRHKRWAEAGVHSTRGRERKVPDLGLTCTDIPLVSADVKSLLESGNFCTSKLAALTSEPSGAQETAASQNPAPRETGMAVAAAAAAVAGFVFAAMQ